MIILQSERVPPDFWNPLHLSAGDEEQLQHTQPAMAACPAPHVPKSGICTWGEFCSRPIGRFMQKAAPHSREITHKHARFFCFISELFFTLYNI